MAEPSGREARTTPLVERIRGRGRPLVVGHRGACRHFPENTNVSFRAGVEAGSAMIEFDIRQTRDGAFVTVHDATWDRTTDGQGAVVETTLEDARGLDAGSWMDDRFGGEPVPTLDESGVAALRAAGYLVSSYTINADDSAHLIGPAARGGLTWDPKDGGRG